MSEDLDISCRCRMEGPRRGGRARGAGHVVILIVAGALLAAAAVGIFIAALHVVNMTVRRGLDEARTEHRIRMFRQGAFAYARDNEHRYPGQADEGTWDSDYTGSQILAACLFGYADQLDKIDSGEIQPHADWAPYEPGMLATIDGRPYTSVDDLERVPGIGAKTVEQLRDQVAVQ